MALPREPEGAWLDRRVALAVRATLVLLLVWLARPILAPIVLGAIFAILLEPVRASRAMQRVPFLRRFPSAAVTFGTVFLVVIPFTILTAHAVQSINDYLQEMGNEGPTRVESAIAREIEDLAQMLGLSTQEIRTWSTRAVREIGQAMVGFVSGFLRALPRLILGLFLFVVSLFYFLRDGRAITAWLLENAPFERAHSEHLFRAIQQTVSGAILGTLAVALVQGTLMIVALVVFGVPGAVFFGLIAAVLALIPMVGTTPVSFGAIVYLGVMGRTSSMIGMIIAAALVGVSDNVVRPWVQGRGGRLHPLVAFVGIFGGLALMGPPGVFIGPVVAAMGLWSLKSYALLKEQQGPRPPPHDA